MASQNNTFLHLGGEGDDTIHRAATLQHHRRLGERSAAEDGQDTFAGAHGQRATEAAA